MLQSPTILSPITDWAPLSNEEYTTSDLIQQIKGTIPVPVDLEDNRLLTVAYSYKIKVGNTETAYTVYSLAGIVAGQTNPEAESVAWSFNTDGYVDLVEGAILTIRFKALEFVNNDVEIGSEVDESDPITLVVNIVALADISPSVMIPTGVKIKRYRDSIKLLVPTSSVILNENSDFLGCNFYVSAVAGGGSSGYQLMNESYVDTADTSETETEVLEDRSVVNEAEDITVTTTSEQETNSEYYTYTMTKAVLRRMVIAGQLPSSIFLSDGSTLNDDVAYFFVTTAVAYDKNLTQVVESYYSTELEGKFIRYQTTFGGLPPRRRSDILLSMIKRLTSNNELVNIVNGYVIRDLSDCVADEFQKQYIIQDFLFISESIDALLQYDDADGDGVSDDVTTSLNKKQLADALGITDATALQDLIDEQFDKHASNFDLTRKGAVSARGTVVFYTTRQPTNDLLIPAGSVVNFPGDPTQGIQPVSFQVIGSRIIEASNANAYYNSAKRRYEVQAEIEALVPGAAGNVPSGVITFASGVDASLSVENLVPTNYGSDSESNSELGARVKLARSSFDSGTKPGYMASAYDVPGVYQAVVEEAGDDLMTRDYDFDSGRHLGGKVDVYIKGSKVLQVIDQVAFKFEYPTDVYGNQIGETFYVIDARDFRVKTTNPRVTVDTPIAAVNRVKNVTRNAEYDLTNIEIMSDTVILDSSSITNTSIGMAALDVIEVDYRYRSSNVLVLSRQPIHEVISVKDKDSVTVDPEKYRVIKIDDPLDTGRSTIAQYGIEFLFQSADEVSEFIDVTGEQHSIRLNSPATLNYKGILKESIVVKSITDPVVTYRNEIDYRINLGSQTEYTTISLISNSMIRSGDTIQVDYRASTNYFVTYTYNSLIQDVQDKFATMKHACADTLAKEAVENMIDLSFNVERDLSVAGSRTGSVTEDENRLRAKIQTGIYNLVTRKKMGETLTQGDVARAILAVPGVKMVQLPFEVMMKRTDSFIPMDDLGHLAFEVFQRTSSAGLTSYRTVNSVLSYSTGDGGGSTDNFRAVYENMIKLEIVDDPTMVAKAPGRAYIQSDGRLIVSTTDGKTPQSKYYKAAYYVSYPSGVTVSEDIEATAIEYLSVDGISFKGIDFTN